MWDDVTNSHRFPDNDLLSPSIVGSTPTSMDLSFEFPVSLSRATQDIMCLTFAFPVMLGNLTNKVYSRNQDKTHEPCEAQPSLLENHWPHKCIQFWFLRQHDEAKDT